MAELFLSVRFDDPRPDQPKFVAIKRLLPAYASKREFVDRLTKEAKLSVFLRHPNIVEVENLGVSGTEIFFSMEFVDGKSLDLILRRLIELHRPLPPDVLFYLFDQITAALAYAHNASDDARRRLDIVHCDITPGNVLVGYDGSVKLSDFGIATVERGSSVATGGGIAFGKLPYMAPEQIRRGPFDQRTDIYSLGVLLHEALTFQKPWKADTAVELEQRILDVPPDIQIDRGQRDSRLEDLIRDCLNKNPADRPQTVERFRERMFGSRFPDRSAGKAELTGLIGEIFPEERASEGERRFHGISAWMEARRSAPASIDELNVETSRSEPSAPKEKTEFLPSAPAEATRVALKAGAQLKPKVGRVGLLKKRVERFFQRPEPVEEIHPDPEKFSARVHIAPPAPRDSQQGEEVTDPHPFEARDLFDFPPPEIASPPPPETEIAPVELPPETPMPVEIVRPAKDRPSRSPKPERVESMEHISISAPSWRVLLAGLALLAAVGGLVLGAAHLRRGESAPSASEVITQAQIFVSIEKLVSAADPKALQSWNDFGKRDQTWRRPLTDFFAREYRRYRPNEPNPVLFSIPEPKSDAPSISWQGSLFNELLPFDEMNRFHGLKNVAPAPNLGVVFVHLYARSESGTSPYPLEHQGKRPDRTGIVYLPLLSKAEGESLARLAHEVGHAMGAKDKTDDHGFAVYPRGYPNPFRDPLHPQTSGELMTRGIAQTAKQYKPFSSLNEIQIGAHTAAEFGWISKESAERFYRGKK